MGRLILPAALCAIVVAGTANAFTVTPKLPSIYTPGGNLPFQVRKVGGKSSTSALQMNLFDRFSRVAKSNLNNILQSLEDPEKIMTQALEDMQVRLHVCGYTAKNYDVLRMVIAFVGTRIPQLKQNS